MAERPGLRFLISHPAHLVALGLGSGLVRPGSGTWGTALSWAIFLILFPRGANAGVVLAILAAGLVIGLWAADHTGEKLGEIDAGEIVVDEIVAFWFVLSFLPSGEHRIALQCAAFVLFRIFDVFKPPPIGAIDRRWKSAAGVMADDFVAAFYTLIVIAIAVRIWPPLGA